MKFSAILLLATAAIAQAGTCPGSKQCQCLFADGSHCCVYGSNAQTGDDYDCTKLCAGASRELQRGDGDTPKKCNAGGAFTCASIITVQDRQPCYNNNAIP